MGMATQLRMRSVRQRRRRLCLMALLVVVVGGLFVASLLFGQTYYSPAEVAGVIAGRDVPGASYTVGELRLPRAALAVVAGACFGAAGTTFQTLLRNQLASPDVIGISAGASAAGVVAILFFDLSAMAVSAWALLGGLAVAGLIYFLSLRDGFAGTRLILIGIGMAAALNSVVTYALSRAAAWDLNQAARWMSGSLNGATWERVMPVALICVAGLVALGMNARDLDVLRLGDDSAASLGVSVERKRLLLIGCAVAMIAVATAACGPVAFVAFMAGPIAGRIFGPASPLLFPAALVGAALVLLSDFVGQFAFGTSYPVGVITGALGAPFLVVLLVRANREGRTL